MTSIEENLVPKFKELATEVVKMRERISKLHSGEDCDVLPEQLRRSNESIYTTLFPGDPIIDELLASKKNTGIEFVNEWWFQLALGVSFATVILLMGIILFVLCMKRKAREALDNINEQLEMQVQA